MPLIHIFFCWEAVLLLHLLMLALYPALSPKASAMRTSVHRQVRPGEQKASRLEVGLGFLLILGSYSPLPG